ncbi:hypothetical protein ACFE04_025950 [Oxalis oulophora]
MASISYSMSQTMTYSSSSISISISCVTREESLRLCSFVKLLLPPPNNCSRWSRRVKLVTAASVAKYKGTYMREKHLTEMIEIKVEEAKQLCQGDAAADECKVAWDEVEEVSQAKADLRQKMLHHDPLESFCQLNPHTDECRIYEY